MATLHLQFFSSLCTIINSIEGPRKHPTNWAPQLLRPALSPTPIKARSIEPSLIRVQTAETAEGCA